MCTVETKALMFFGISRLIVYSTQQRPTWHVIFADQIQATFGGGLKWCHHKWHERCNQSAALTVWAWPSWDISPLSPAKENLTRTSPTLWKINKQISAELNNFTSAEHRPHQLPGVCVRDKFTSWCSPLACVGTECDRNNRHPRWEKGPRSRH